MKVLLAGATGAFGQALTAALVKSGHEVLALGRDSSADAPIAAQKIVADVLDRDALLRSVDGQAADVVMHQLTALRKIPVKYADMDMTNKLRTQGTVNLLAVAREVGASRFLTQSMVPGYGFVDHGERLITENDPFGQARGSKADPTVAGMLSTEQQAFTADGIDGIALRYGAFYGLRGSDGVLAALRAGKLPVPRNGGLMSWIHLADAADATVAAIGNGVGGQAYNVVDDLPISWAEMFAEHARVVGAKPPKVMPTWLIRLAAPYYATIAVDTSMRVSNAKAKAELGWIPSYPTYRDGVATLATHN